MNQDTLARVVRVISKFADVPVEDVKPDSHLAEDLGLDSLTALEIVFELEEEFGIVVPEDQTADFTTVESVCKGVEDLLAAEQPSG